MKKIMTLGLAALLTFSLTIPALATAGGTDTKSTITADGNEGDVELKGTILASGAKLLSVTMPTSIDFQIAVNNDSTFERITTATSQEYRTISSTSTHAVKVEIAAVQDVGVSITANSKTKSFPLLDQIKLAIYDTSIPGASAALALADDSVTLLNGWSTGDPASAHTLIADLAPSSSRVLDLAAAAKDGWAITDTDFIPAGGVAGSLIPGTYTVTTTLKVSFVPDATPAP